jgi:deoxyribose-phosphate aldolase
MKIILVSVNVLTKVELMELNNYIDHTLLKADATIEQIRELCAEAKEYNFKAVCINSSYVPDVKKILSGSDVKICTVVGFPLGSSPSEVKALEANIAIDNGAHEIDMVINVGALKNKSNEIVKNEIKLLAETCHKKNTILKVIIETCLLTDEEKIRVCTFAKEVGADFVKTSTGFSTAGALVEDIVLMRKAVGPEMGVKASGGVRDIETANAMINAGATRLGTSSGIKLMKGEVSTSSY